MASRPIQETLGQEVDLLFVAELLERQPSSLPSPKGLQVCPTCSLPFVVPGDVREVVGPDRVLLDLHCTNCDWADTAVHGDAELAGLDLQLDQAFADLLWTLELVWIANEEAAILRFAEALDAGALLPEDF
jgi:hypothetical protein